MTETAPIRVLIVDDHAMVREGLTALLDLDDSFRVVGQARNGREACDQQRQLQADVVLLDLRMPDLDGVEALRELARLPGRVLVLTTSGCEEDLRRCLHLGARGYLLKDSESGELFEEIKEVHAGRMYCPANCTAQLAASLSTEPLTAREIEVLQAVAVGRANKQIAAALHIGSGTVKSHVRSILHKLAAQSRTEAVAVAFRRGIIRLTS